jgi:hypothetical protein
MRAIGAQDLAQRYETSNSISVFLRPLGFNGTPQTLGRLIGAMHVLKAQAQMLMQMLFVQRNIYGIVSQTNRMFGLSGYNRQL